MPSSRRSAIAFASSAGTPTSARPRTTSPCGRCAFGETCFVSLECEAYAELGIEIRERSPFPRTVFAAYEGTDVIYVAPPRYYAPPVPMQVFNSPFGRDAARVLVDGAVELLHALRADG